jgi:beta-phosphoglucomutase
MIFDLDGVIVDTAKYHFQSWQKLAHSIGGELTEKQNQKLKGVSRMASLDKILLWNSIELSEEQKENLAALKNSWYQSKIKQLGPHDGLPGAISFVENAKAMGFKISLGSASKNAPTILKALQIEHLFDTVIDGNSTSKSKPDPEVFLLGAQALKVKPSQTIVFEDALRGIEAAIAGGFHSVGVGDSDLLNIADFVIPGLGEVSVEEVINRMRESKNADQ